MHRAQCYYDQGEHADSIKDLNLALSIKEDDPQVHYRLGLAFYAD
jgi:tetratricopeptide (TPR) repeat protein